MQNILSKSVAQEFIDRINSLTSTTNPKWGKMNVAQMLAHCSVAYEMVYDEEKFQPVGTVKRFFLKAFVKNQVVGSKPYPKNGRTAPEFKITENRDFEVERKRLIDYVKKTADLGASYFDGKENRSFGKLSKEEWNMLFAKHLDHHLRQFGV